MHTIADIADFLQEFAPPRLAEDWDNVGLLVGDRSRQVRRVMTCLTITPPSAAEAIHREADLIVTHHPLPFRALKRITTETTAGAMLLDLIGAHIAVYSPHTAFDSARQGINQRLGEGLGLAELAPLIPGGEGDELSGGGRWGRLAEPMPLGGLAERLKDLLAVERVQLVGNPERLVRTVAVACGAADDFLEEAVRAGCDGLVTGETRFHTCLEAEARGVGLILPGHFASERFAVECLADVLAKKFPTLEVWASTMEQDPLQWF